VRQLFYLHLTPSDASFLQEHCFLIHEEYTMDTPTWASPTDDTYEGIKRLLGFLSETQSGSSGLDRDQLRRVLANPLFRILIARDTRKSYPESVVGMASIFYPHKLRSTVAEIHDVVVDPACRGEGLGERLVLGLIADAKERAAKTGNDIVISLTSKPSRVAANQLYQKLGFERTARSWRKNNTNIGTNLYRMTVTPPL
jgi:ribosomal protein S18 acetylase RimI-like enzyme